MKEISIRKVETSSDWNHFKSLVWIINKNDTNWVPPLRFTLNQLFDLKKNPFWETALSVFYIATIDNKPVGRIAGIILKGDKNNTGYFGFLESIHNDPVFSVLFTEVEKWLKSNGCHKIIGPVCPSINYETGALISGFETPPFYMLAHNPSYYNECILNAGFKKEKDFFSYLIDSAAFNSTAKIMRTMEALQKRQVIKIRNLNLQNFKTEMELVRVIYNDAFKDHWGFSSMEEKEFQYMAKDMTQIIDPELALVLEYANEPVGFILALPNMNELFIRIKNGKLFPFGFMKFLFYRKRIKYIRVLTIAIKHKFQHLGLGGFLYSEIGKRVKEKGYLGGEMSWVMEDNIQMNKAAKEMGGRIYKTYRLYSKSLI